MIALLLVLPGVAALIAGIDANRRDGDWAFPWQGSLVALGLAQLGLVVASVLSANPAAILVMVLLSFACVPATVLYAMQADNHPRARKPFQPDRFPTGRG